jgi:antitoxin component YwqK of YwqJK toxin-antitoxin module
MRKIYINIRFLIILYFSFFIFHSSLSQDTTSIRNGYQKFHYKSGAVSSEGTMKNGQPDGYWKSFYENGKIKSEGNRKNFELDSIWIFYNEKGQRILDVNYRNGKKNGIKTTYLEKEMIREMFRNDVKEGYTRYYYDDGKVKMEIPFVKGLEQGLAKEYSTDGNIITLIEYKRGFVIDRVKINRRDHNNLKQGKWYTFYGNGNIHVEGTYQDDLKEGYFKEYAENGDLVSVDKYVKDIKQAEAQEIRKLDIQNEYYPGGKIKSSGTYRDGTPEGIYREYDTVGKITRSLVYDKGTVTGEGIVKEDGSRDGHWLDLYPDGKIKAEGDYKDGKQVGEWKFYYPDRKLEQVGRFTSAGKLHGTWKWYYDSGQLMREEEYDNGLKDGMHTEYDENGKIVEEGEYIKDLEDGPWFTTIGDYLERGTYRDGLKNGKWVSYQLLSVNTKTDSILSFSGSFVEDNPDGKHIYYWDNGKVKDEGFYLMGKKEGDWIKYEYDGTPFLVITYRNGVEIKYDGYRIKPPFEPEDQ